MKKLIGLFIVLAISIMAATGSPADLDETLPFYEGEQLEFDVYYKALKLGSSKLTFHGEKELDGKNLYYITFRTNVPGFQDEEEIYAYKGSFLPYRILRDIKRGGAFPIKICEDYDQKSYKVDIEEKGTLLTKRQTITKDCPIHNALLLTYLYRTRLNPERCKVSIPMLDFDIVSEGKKTVMTDAGERSAYIFTGEPSKFTFWLSADENRVPLKITGHSMLEYSLVLVNVKNVALLSSPKE